MLLPAGIAMVSEDRRAEGIIPIRSARENITLPFIRKNSGNMVFISKKAESRTAEKMIEKIPDQGFPPRNRRYGICPGEISRR